MSDVGDAIAAAEAHARDHDWGAAAVEYARAAARAGQSGDRATARQAWEAAGEAWRRDDRPETAAQALERSLESTPEGPSAALGRLKLAGVLSELGRTADAVRLLDDAASALPAGPLHALVLDTWLEALFAMGDRAQADVVAYRLSAHVGGLGDTDPVLAMAVAFREGQIARLDGRLADAAGKFALVIAEVEDLPDAVPALAAAEAELAEIASLRGDWADALALWDQARDRFARVGRRALDWRAEAGRVRAAVDAGTMVMVPALDEGIAVAAERAMVPLEVDLRIARGVARAVSDAAGARQDLELAIAAADGCGLRWRAGRGRLELARRVATDATEIVSLAERAAEALTGNEPWRWRAIATSAAARGDTNRLIACLARFEGMEMSHDADAARERLI